MPLSEYEKQVLAQMERQLASDDPKLASRMGDDAPPRHVGRVVVGVATVILGLVILVIAVMLSQAWLGIIGFIGMLAGAWFAVMRRTSAGQRQGAAAPTASPSRAGSSRFMDRIEARWERRRSNGMM